MARLVDLLLLLALAVPAPALARRARSPEPPTIYINGVRVDRVQDTVLRGVNVRFDEDGNIWIDAPGYVIQGTEPASSGEAAQGRVPAGRFWLVTEDRDAYGHVVDVLVNGERVATLRSGASNPVVDLAPYLHHGLNTVRFEARPGPPPSGGSFRIFVGQGQVEEGMLRFSEAQVEYVRDVSSPPGEVREFNLTVEPDR